MKVKLTPFVILILLSTLSYSQNTRIVLEGNDTLAIIPIHRIKSANLLFIKGEELSKLNLNLNQQIDIKEFQLGIRVNQLILKDSIISHYSQIAQEKDSIISNKDLIISDKDSTIKKNKKKSILSMMITGLVLIISII